MTTRNVRKTANLRWRDVAGERVLEQEFLDLGSGARTWEPVASETTLSEVKEVKLEPNRQRDALRVAADVVSEAGLQEVAYWLTTWARRGLESESELGVLLTGSRAYGTPKTTSDVDLVVLTSKSVAALLKSVGAGRVRDAGESDGVDSLSLRFGRLNLIIATDVDDFEIWRIGTEQLRKRAPVTRAEAIAHFTELRGDI